MLKERYFQRFEPGTSAVPVMHHTDQSDSSGCTHMIIGPDFRCNSTLRPRTAAAHAIHPPHAACRPCSAAAHVTHPAPRMPPTHHTPRVARACHWPCHRPTARYVWPAHYRSPPTPSFFRWDNQLSGLFLMGLMARHCAMGKRELARHTPWYAPPF